jgi:hypothetical protein
MAGVCAARDNPAHQTGRTRCIASTIDAERSRGDHICKTPSRPSCSVQGAVGPVHALEGNVLSFAEGVAL